MAVAFDACFGSPLALWDLSMPVRRSAGCHRMPTEPPTWRDRLCRRCRPSRIIPIPSSTFNVWKRGKPTVRLASDTTPFSSQTDWTDAAGFTSIERSEGWVSGAIDDPADFLATRQTSRPSSAWNRGWHRLQGLRRQTEPWQSVCVRTGLPHP